MATKPAQPRGDYGRWQSQFRDAGHALTALSPLQFLVEPMYLKTSLNLIYGISGSHKTNLMLDLAVCLATAQPWLPGQPGMKARGGFATASGPIVWVDVDSGRRALDERFGASVRALGGNKKTPIHYISFPEPPFTALNREPIEALIATVLDRSAVAVFIDNLGTVSGGADENSAQMIPVMSSLRNLSERCKVAVFVIHHDAKNPNFVRKTPRGHSSIEAALNTASWVQREGDVVTITPTKLRDAPWHEYAALYTYSHQTQTRTLDQARFYGIAPQVNAKMLKAEQAVFAALKQAKVGLNQSDLIQILGRAGMGRNNGITFIEELVRQGGIIERRAQARNAILYTLP